MKFNYLLPAFAMAAASLDAAVVTGTGEIDNSHSSLFARYDADNYDGTTWTDSSSGAGNDLVNSGGTKPVVATAGGPNGEQFADFRGSDRIFSNASDLEGGQYTIFMVSRLDEITNGYFFDGTTGSQRGFMFAGSNGQPNKYTMTGAGSSTEDAVTGEWLLHTMIFDGSGTSSHSIGGVEQYSGTGSVATFQTVILGGRYTQSSFLDGGIADFLVYDTVLTESEIGDVEAALGSTYGVAIPEPSSTALLGLGGLALLLRRRK